MKRTALTRKKKMKAKTPLKRKSKLKANPYCPKFPYASIFTGDLQHCFITGSSYNVEIHHIFGASNKHNSEKYHFLLPLRHDWHVVSKYSIHRNRVLDLKYKRLCEAYWLEHLGNREAFIKVFGKWW